MKLCDCPNGNTYIAAHRGSCGGNIPCNTLLAYDLAIREGADIIELDVARSLDGTLYCFHPGMESVLFRDSTPVSQLSDQQLAVRRLRNPDLAETQYTVPRLEEAFSLLKDRCVIAIDKFWMNMGEIAELVRENDLQDQVLCKLQNNREQFHAAEELAPDLPLLPVLHREDTVTEELLSRKLRVAGIEAIFGEETDPIASDEYITWIHENGMLLWCNSIIYNQSEILTAGHTDDVSLALGPERGWGWLYRKQFDIIQTDWVAHLRRYLDQQFQKKT